jgi:alanine-alpha-ketoisovalerate/valine-pyruvate aminotransferase
MTKTEKVKIHLENVGHITSLEAIELYGATRLSAIIYNLRNKYGMNIITETIEFTDRFGNAAHYAKYIFKGEENGNNK